MIVTCSMCHCSITLNVAEGPLRVCPMCGHNFACTWFNFGNNTDTQESSSTTGRSEKDIEDKIWWAEHIMKLEEEKE